MQGTGAHRWERQDDESPEAFEAFALYRDMGATRSLRRVARELDKSLTLIGRWSSDRGWQDRVAAWDAEQDRAKQDGYLEEVREAGRRQAETARRQVEVLGAPALEIVRRLEQNPAVLAELDLASLLGLAMRAAKPLAQLMHAERDALRVAADVESYQATCSSCNRDVNREDVSTWTRAEAREYLLGLESREPFAPYEEELAAGA